MDPQSELPRTGQVVQARQRTWLVTNTGPHTRVALSCLDEDAAGEAIEVLWDLEPGARPVPETLDLTHDLARLDDPEMFGAYLSALRWHCVTSTDKRLLQAPFRAGIDLKPYQLEPLRKALELPRVNLFIADDVGLGKTIEAGLVLQELLLRQRVDRVLVICPPAVVPQWQEELDQRFGLRFEVYDREYVAARRRERGWGVNPWSTAPRFIVSTTLLRGRRTRAKKGVPQTDHRELLLKLFSQRMPRTLLIFDEAHHAAPASRSVYAVDSHTTRAIREVAERFEHRLFLSATPHNGLSNSFSALLQLLDPQRFTRGTPVEGVHELEPIMVRRLKKHLRAQVGGLPERILVDHTIRLAPDEPERVLGHLLAKYDDAYREHLKDLSDREQAARGLVLVNLHKRLLSSIPAFLQTLKAHARGVQQRLAGTPGPKQLALPRQRDEDIDEAELDQEELEITENLTILPSESARSLLTQMLELASSSAEQPDGRLKALATWINEHLLSDSAWAPRRLVIFTEYEDTLRWLQRRLPALLATHHVNGRIEVYLGERSTAAREQVKRAFNADPAVHPLRILLATDAAREGINLQAHCNHLFHFDLPWNPARVEQRNGRIDRTLQPMEQVFCHYFDLPDRPEDKVLTYMVKRIKVITEELGSLSDVLSLRLAARLEKGLRKVTLKDVDTSLTPDERAVEAVRQLEGRYEADANILRGDLGALERLIETSKKRVGYDTEQLHHLVDLGLRLATGQGLQPLDPQTDPPAWHLPKLDATWASTLAPLRETPPPDAPPWFIPAVRPVAFRAAHRLDAPTVQLHLGHPVVKRLLARFHAQGFAAHDLARVTLLHTPEESVRRVLLLGKLSLFGDRATRLHEEVLLVGAQWTADNAPTPYKGDARRRATEVLEQHLRDPKAHPEASANERARKHAARDVAALWPALLETATEAEAAARQALSTRGEAEANEMVRVLERQRTRILQVQANRQLPLLLTDADKEQQEQFERDLRSMAKRLGDIEIELDREPAAIRRTYTVALRRFEPVGLVYLWP
jgi:SNF2 family DNA or RNA helicase